MKLLDPGDIGKKSGIIDTNGRYFGESSSFGYLIDIHGRQY